MAESMMALRTRAKELEVKMPQRVTKLQLAELIEKAEAAVVEPVHVNETEVIKELTNPETTPDAIKAATVADTLTDEQKNAKLEKEIKAKINKEQIEKRLRLEASIAEQKERQKNKYVLKYDIVEMEQQCQAIARGRGCTFRIDKQPDGSLTGTYHMFGRGKENSGNLAQPLEIILRDTRLFCGIKSVRDEIVKTEKEGASRSVLTGEVMDTPVKIIGAAPNESTDIATESA